MAGTGKLTTKAIAVVVILAMLAAVGISPVIMVFMIGVVFVLWFSMRRAQVREVEHVFDFYIAADAILREEERRWYGFEIAEVIEQGESLLEILPDPPPLNYFALGALYHRLENHHATVEYLGHLMEDKQHDEAHRIAPSPQLRHYVMMLRTIEREPSTAPQSLSALRSLERLRQRFAEQMLSESRSFVEAEKSKAPELKEANTEMMFAPSLPLNAICAPPPISKVLRDVYHDETSANN